MAVGGVLQDASVGPFADCAVDGSGDEAFFLGDADVGGTVEFGWQGVEVVLE